MRIFQITSAVMIGMASLLAVSCNNGNDPDYTERPTKERQDIVLTRSEQAMVDGHAKFAFDFFRELNSQTSQEQENMVVSPIGLTIDLSILANAIDDDSYADFLKLMDIDPTTTRSDMNDLCKYLVDELLDVDTQVDLIIANSIWTSDKYPAVRDDFANEVMEKYGAPVQSVDFTDTESELIINGWAKEATSGLITKIHEANPQQTLVIAKLCNALYFNGEWAEKFNKDKTSNKDFNNIDGTISNVPMMYGESTAYNLNDGKSAILGLPFGNGAYTMYFIMPNEGMDFGQSISSIDFDKWTGYKQKLNYITVKLTIPKLDIDGNVDLQETLVKMGLDTFIDSKAELAYMLESPIKLEKILVDQACSIKLDENGGTAAAATVSTALLSMATSTPQSGTLEVVLDRPFMLLIEETSTGAILFMGKVVKM